MENLLYVDDCDQVVDILDYMLYLIYDFTRSSIGIEHKSPENCVVELPYSMHSLHRTKYICTR